MYEDFDGGNLRVARLSLGLSLQDVAEKVSKSKQYIHQLEINQTQPTSDLEKLLAQSLEVTDDFFCKKTFVSIHESQLHFRKLGSTLVSQRQQALAQAEILRRFVAWIDEQISLPKVNFESYSPEVLTADDIEIFAERCRAAWNLGNGPIASMTRLAETNGAIVAELGDVTEKIDALSINASRPLIIRNPAKNSACRQRFDIAHEIGHLILHSGRQTGDKITESQANRFAIALLLPKSIMINHFPRPKYNRLDWKGLSEFKLYWKVSKAAILYRARQLNLIDDLLYKRGFMYLKRGEATLENEDHLIPLEIPEVLDKAVRYLMRTRGLSLIEVAAKIGVSPLRIHSFCNTLQKNPTLRVV